MRTKKGIVTSAKMTRTVTVTVHTHALHPKYKKRYRVSKKFLADSGDMTIREGDQVLIGECRPLSKNKHFRVLEIIKQAAEVSELREEAQLEQAINREKKNAPASDDNAGKTAKTSSDSPKK